MRLRVGLRHYRDICLRESARAAGISNLLLRFLALGEFRADVRSWLVCSLSECSVEGKDGGREGGGGGVRGGMNGDLGKGGEEWICQREGWSERGATGEKERMKKWRK